MHLLHMYPPIHLSCLWLVYPLTLTKCSCIRRAVGRRRLYTTFQWQTGYELFFQVSLPLFLQDFNLNLVYSPLWYAWFLACSLAYVRVLFNFVNVHGR